MGSTNDYLKRHYLTQSQLAEVVGISADRIERLIQAALTPEPSYVVTRQMTLVSPVFGEMPADDAEPGEYFHRNGVSWVLRALDVEKVSGGQEARDRIKAEFTRNFAAALKELNQTLLPMLDSFTRTGKVLEDGLAKRTNTAWHHFLKGVFSLCVADPSTEKSIAEKEVLQEALSKLSDNGTKTHFTESERSLLHSLIERYAHACMPFSPKEYPRSSRKRLVEDLLAKLKAM